MEVKKYTEAEAKQIIDAAFKAAAEATQAYIDADPGNWYPCGFAWVRIKPARGTFVKVLKSEKLGRTDEFYGGFVVYNPSNNITQSMDAKAAGARAFADTLRQHGVKIKVETRID